tara:strand:- start:17413 stop:17601 length:189 start_codon:yes stop_codon:yes gene_type:complete
MARVIKIDPEKEKTMTHSECGAVIGYFENEIESHVENEPYGGGTDTYHYLTCPNCHKEMRWC